VLDWGDGQDGEDAVNMVWFWQFWFDDNTHSIGDGAECIEASNPPYNWSKRWW